MKEYKDRYKKNEIIDRRFGENDPNMTEEEKLMQRFILERKVEDVEISNLFTVPYFRDITRRLACLIWMMTERVLPIMDAPWETWSTLMILRCPVEMKKMKVHSPLYLYFTISFTILVDDTATHFGGFFKKKDTASQEDGVEVTLTLLLSMHHDDRTREQERK